MGRERAAVLQIDNNGNVQLPITLKGKLRFSKRVYVAIFPLDKDTCHVMTINQDEKNNNNIKEKTTNKQVTFNFPDGLIPVSKFLSTDITREVVVWFNEDTKELIFKLVYSI